MVVETETEAEQQYDWWWLEPWWEEFDWPPPCDWELSA